MPGAFEEEKGGRGLDQNKERVVRKESERWVEPSKLPKGL